MERIRIQDPGWKEFRSGIRDGKHLDPGSEINILDPDPNPEHCCWVKLFDFQFI
jgi:hypothetical protein